MGIQSPSFGRQRVKEVPLPFQLCPGCSAAPPRATISWARTGNISPSLFNSCPQTLTHPPHTPTSGTGFQLFELSGGLKTRGIPCHPQVQGQPKEESGSAGPGWPGTGPVPPVTARQLDTTAAKNARNVGGCVLPAPLPPPSSQNRIFPIQGNPVPLWENRGVAGHAASHCICTDKLGWAPRVGVSSTAG